ncbi:hypothetical protein [Ideonella sp. YS5]|uniref:hypothetical protein n=1 Tax=Ideonella sp. YS5 TaxID=3453714 RepID=UPI003EEFBD79
MSLHLMQVPGWLLAAVDAKSAFVDGAVVKDAATRQILAHLQPTQQLSNLVFEQGLGLVSQPLTAFSSVAGNLQLLELKHMVEQVQMVASIGAAASVLNLGISVGGFAMVLHSLRRVESKVDAVAASINSVAMLQKAEFMGRCSHALRRAEDAFSLSAPAERLRYWQEADSLLAELTEVALHLVASQGLPLEGAPRADLTERDRLRLLASPPVLDTLRWLMAFSAARTEVLLCLGHPGNAAEVASRSVEWLAPLPASVKALAQARLAGRVLPPSQMQVVTSLAKATGTLVAAGREVASSRAALCRDLHAQGADTTQHMLQLREDLQARVLAWAPPEPPAQGRS